MKYRLHSYDNDIWRKAASLCCNVHKLAAVLPIQERNGLYKKLRASSELVPVKIAQGKQSSLCSEYREKLQEAFALLSMIDVEVNVAFSLEYIERENVDSIQKDIDNLSQYLQDMILQLDTMSNALNASFAYYYPHVSNN